MVCNAKGRTKAGQPPIPKDCPVSLPQEITACICCVFSSVRVCANKMHRILFITEEYTTKQRKSILFFQDSGNPGKNFCAQPEVVVEKHKRICYNVQNISGRDFALRRKEGKGYE